MFEWFFNGITNLRIAAGFHAYEKSLRAEHHAAVKRRFCVEALRDEARSRMSTVEARARKRFDGKVTRLDRSMEALEARLSADRRDLGILTFPYKDVLDALFGEKAELIRIRQGVIEEMREVVPNAYVPFSCSGRFVNGRRQVASRHVSPVEEGIACCIAHPTSRHQLRSGVPSSAYAGVKV